MPIWQKLLWAGGIILAIAIMRGNGAAAGHFIGNTVHQIGVFVDNL